MKVELLHHTPLWVCAKAIRKCWASEGKSDSNYVECGPCGEKDKELIDRVGNKNKHASTLEHLVYTFDIDGISRACLQELARHRLASYSVKSTRYTLKELKETKSLWFDAPKDCPFKDGMKYLVDSGDAAINSTNIHQLAMVQNMLNRGLSNDKAKYCLPEAYKTSLVMTINARSLQNFLSLRTSKSALWEIQDLARELYIKLPSEHKYLFSGCVKEV
jgi:thymidylate synthase (FAD)